MSEIAIFLSGLGLGLGLAYIIYFLKCVGEGKGK